MANIFDIHIQTTPIDQQLLDSRFMSFGFESTIGVKGFQMLINMWMKCFLTGKGSDPTNPDYGTAFTGLIGSNVPITQVQDVVDIAVSDCNSQILAIQRKTTGLSMTEKLSSAAIIEFIESPASPGFEAYVEIQNLANERLVVNLPPIASV